jgi:hypothetical protein
LTPRSTVSGILRWLAAEILARRIDLDHLGALVARVGDEALQPLEMAVGDDRGIVIIVEQRGYIAPPRP